MKRKLNELDVPEEVAQNASIPATPTFDSFGLDPRLLQAIAAEKFSRPTPIQARAIPVSLRGQDVLGKTSVRMSAWTCADSLQARAKTGTGKTAAYLLPILNTILKRKAKQGKAQSTTALVIVPTKELASQVTKAVGTFSTFCTQFVSSLDLTHQTPDQAQQAALAANPDIVIATPARAAHHGASSSLKLARLAHLVIDEADLVLSYGFDADFRSLVNYLPHGVQTSLASATLTTEVDTLKGLFCRDPVILDLQDDEKGSSAINQYIVKCGEDEKFLILFAVFKLKLLQGKCIVFVGDVDRCYRLKLFLEQFGIKSCVLNSELPVNCRIHVVEEFNKNVYDVIIATDEHEVVGGEETVAAKKSDTKASDEPTEARNDPQDGKKGTETRDDKAPNGENHTAKPSTRNSKKDREFGISRGIDFQNVASVLNFDLPVSAKSYTHRIGRTARAGKGGIALSLVVPKDQYFKDKRTTFPTTKHDETVLGAVSASQEKKGQKIQPYHFDMAKLEGFRYRVASALKAVSSGAIRQARITELRQELLKSEKLKRHLEENPDDLRYLRHDMEVRAARVQPHLKHVPDYLLPSGKESKNVGQPLGEVGFVGPGRQSENRIREARKRNKLRTKRGKSAGKANPLKTFKANSRK